MRVNDLLPGTEVAISAGTLKRLYGIDYSQDRRGGMLGAMGAMLHELGASSPTGLPPTMVRNEMQTLRGVVLRSALPYGSARREIGVEVDCYWTELVDGEVMALEERECGPITVIVPCSSIRGTWAGYLAWREDLAAKVAAYKAKHFMEGR